MGRGAGVGGNAVKFKSTVPGHEGLAGAALLARTAKVDHRSLPAGALQIALHGKGRAEGAGAQQIVAAAVTAALPAALLAGDAGGLTQTAEGVKLPQNADDRPARAKAAGKGGGNARKLLLHAKALPAQHIAKIGRGLEFGEGRFRMVPQIVGGSVDEFLFLIHYIQKIQFHIIPLSALYAGWTKGFILFIIKTKRK